MKMKEHLNRKCNIEIDSRKSLFYTGTITSIDEKTITFIDKYNNVYTYPKGKILEINESEG